MVIIQRWGRGQHQESIRSCHLSVANIQNRLKANSFQNFHRAFFRKQCFKEDEEKKVNQICIWKSPFPTQAIISAFGIVSKGKKEKKSTDFQRKFGQCFKIQCFQKCFKQCQL